MPAWAWLLVAIGVANLGFVLCLVRGAHVRQKRIGELRDELRAAARRHSREESSEYPPPPAKKRV